MNRIFLEEENVPARIRTMYMPAASGGAEKVIVLSPSEPVAPGSGVR